MWRQKFTVIVNTPQGQASGSSVVEVTSIYFDKDMAGNVVSYGVVGDAAVVEVAPGQYMFALVAARRHNLAELFYRAAPERFKSASHDRQGWLSEIPKQVGIVEIPRDRSPELVTFRDINDQTSVAYVSPFDLAKTFGPGFSLDKITLEITNEPITRGEAHAALNWLPKTEPKTFTNLFGRRLANSDPLSELAFSSFANLPREK